MHYLPADGNLVFGDGEVVRNIVVPMPKRVEYFDEDEVAFKLCLGEPTGGASLNVYEANVVLQNDIGMLRCFHEIRFELEEPKTALCCLPNNLILGM